MKENQRLKKLLKAHFNGDPWIDVNLMQSLKGLKAKDAAKKLHGLNSIWEIVNHMACWRQTIVKRLQGEKTSSPAHNYFIPLTDTSTKAWAKALSNLKASQKELLSYLSKEIMGIDEIPNDGNYSRYELLQGVLQHDAYHLGQISLIKKMLGQL